MLVCEPAVSSGTILDARYCAATLLRRAAMGRYYIHVIDGEFANVHQVRQHVVENAKDLIQERLQDRSRWSACAFLIANEAGQSLLRIPVKACLDSGIIGEP